MTSPRPDGGTEGGQTGESQPRPYDGFRQRNPNYDLPPTRRGDRGGSTGESPPRPYELRAGTEGVKGRGGLALEAVAHVVFNVLVDFVDRGVQRVLHIRAVGDVGQRLLEDQRRRRVTRRNRTDQRLLVA